VKHLSAIDSFLLSLNHFLNLCAKDVYLSVDQIAAPRNMKPVSLLALDDEFVGLRNVNVLAYTKPDQLSTIVNRLVAFRTYSFTTSICLSITQPVNRSIVTCTQ
jgi:hypothetical protein